MSGKSELRIFDHDMGQVVVDSASFVDVNPQTSLSENANTIEFCINGSEIEYMDLNDTLLYLRLKVTAADGKDLTNQSTITPSNFFMNALFSDVTLQLNDVVVEGGNQLYAYKSTFESIFGFSNAAKKTQLRPMGYSEDENESKDWVKMSRTMELMGALRLDFLNQPKYLIPGVNVRIKLQRSVNKFALVHGGGNPLIKITQAKMYVRRVRVAPAVSLAHNKGLATSKNAIYAYNRGHMLSYSIAQGSMSHYNDNLFSTKLLPKFVVVGFVKAAAYNGSDLEADPFNFEHFDVSSVGLFRDGQSLPYRELYEPNFAEGLYTREYVKSIVHCTQHLNTNLTNGIDLEKFARGGYTFFTFNLTPDFDYNQRQMPRDGNLRLEVKFAKPLDKAINVLIYATFDSELQITKNREIVNVH